MGAVAEDVRVVGTLAAANDTVRVSQPGTAVVTAQLTGTFVGTVVFEVDNDEGASPNWVAVNAQNVNTAAAVSSATAPGIFKIDAAGLRQVRVRCSAYTSGSIAVTLNASVAAAAPGLTSGGSAVSIADGSDTALGTTTDAKTLGDTNGTAISKLRGLSTILNDVWDSVNHWFQVKLMAAVPTGTNTIGAVTGPAAAALALDATVGTTNTEIGALNETAPATDTASSGLNGRLQRVAQRLTSLIALLPSALVSNRLDVNLGAAPATVTAQGAAAAGAAVSGNPVLSGARDGSGNAQSVGGNNSGWFVQGPIASNASGLSTLNPVPVGGIASDGTTARFAAVNNGFADSQSNNFNSFVTNSYNGYFNGTSWDRTRNNSDVTLLASAARTTLQNSANITAYNCKGIIVTVDVTATVSTVSLTPSINYIDPASGKAIPLLTGTAIAAAGTTTYWVDEAALASVPAPFTKTAQAALGRVITINIAVGNANSQTYSVGYTIIP